MLLLRIAAVCGEQRTQWSSLTRPKQTMSITSTVSFQYKDQIEQHVDLRNHRKFGMPELLGTFCRSHAWTLSCQREIAPSLSVWIEYAPAGLKIRSVQYEQFHSFQVKKVNLSCGGTFAQIPTGETT